MASNLASLKVKSNAKWICQECGSTEFIQGHHHVPKDDSTIIPLCANCHSQKHPDVPHSLFFTKNHQPYWENVSASSLARQLDRHPRTICRVAKRLGIPTGVLSDDAKSLIANSLSRSYQKHTEPVNRGEIQIPKLKCLRCRHTWTPRVGDVRQCPKCKSAHWDTPKKEQS